MSVPSPSRRLLLWAAALLLVACNVSGRRGPGGSASSLPVVKMLARKVPASKQTLVMPLAVGQWTRFRVKRPDETVFVTDKVIGKEGDAFWIESVMERPGRKVVTQALVAMKDRGSPGAARIRALKVKMPDGKLQEYRGRQLGSAQLMYQRVMSSVDVPKLAGLPRAKLHVPAGAFEGCYRRHVSSKYENIRADATVWTHPAVPISGTVKLLNDEKDITVELADFGTTGAKSTL